MKFLINSVKLTRSDVSIVNDYITCHTCKLNDNSNPQECEKCWRYDKHDITDYDLDALNKRLNNERD